MFKNEPLVLALIAPITSRDSAGVVVPTPKFILNEPESNPKRLFLLPLMFPLALIWLNVTLAVVATSCPIAMSFAFAVTPVPPITFKVLFAAIVPPPVNPVPAITLTSP